MLKSITVVCVLPRECEIINKDALMNANFTTLFSSEPESLLKIQNLPNTLAVMYLPARNGKGYGESAQRAIRKLLSNENFYLLSSNPSFKKDERVYKISSDKELESELLRVVMQAIRYHRLASAA